MKGVPLWILDSFKDNAFECPHCGDNFYKDGIDAVSIRKAYKESDKIVLCIEYKCPRCQKSAMIELKEITFELFISNSLEEMSSPDSGSIVKYNQKEAKDISKFSQEKENMEDNDNTDEENHDSREKEKIPKAKKRPKSKISNKETLSAKKILKDSTTYQEWLDAIGAVGYNFDMPKGKKNSKLENTFKVIGMDNMPTEENNDKNK